MARPRTVSREQVLSRMRQAFRSHGYNGASIATLAESTGLAKAALYHHFPGGKEEMAAAVLTDLRAWSLARILGPLGEPGEPRQRLQTLADALDELYQGGHEPCLVGLFSAGEALELFGSSLEVAFADLIAAIRDTLRDAGLDADLAEERAEDAVVRIQGALIVSRGLGRTGPFERLIAGLPDQLLAGTN